MSNQEHKAIFRRYLEDFHGRGQLDLAETIIALPLRQDTLLLAHTLRSAFADLTVRVLHQVAEGDIVATVWEAQGTHQGNWPSPLGPIAATGRSVRWTGTTTVRIADGQISAILGSNWDHLGILQQMGVLGSMAPRPGA